MRRLMRAFFGLVLRIFFRHLEVHGAQKLPASGPAVVVLNHPSGLIDPLFVLCLLPRPASFLAKAPLFRIPILGAIVRALDSIPVYRKQDGADTAQNRETFEAARAVLARGGVLALFPEGTSHDEPHLLPLKTGAARIALGAAAAGGAPLQVVPAGLTFADKTRFRSDALLRFGEPFPVEPGALDADGEPAADAVRALTARVQEGLAQVVLQAEREEALALVASAERILSASGDAPLSKQFELRQRVLEGWARLRAIAPERAAAIERRIRRYEAVLAQTGLEPALLDPRHFRVANVLSFSLRALAVLLVLLPLAVAGAALHAPAWFAVDTVARRLAKKDLAVLATMKVLAGLVFYPATWAALGTAVGLRFGLAAGWAAPACAIVAAFAALRFLERLDAVVGGARALGLFVLRRRAFLFMAQERQRLEAELLQIARELFEPGASAAG